MVDWTAARDWLCNPKAEVSAHYIISPQGEVVSLVDEDQRVNPVELGEELAKAGFSAIDLSITKLAGLPASAVLATR